MELPFHIEKENLYNRFRNYVSEPNAHKDDLLIKTLFEFWYSLKSIIIIVNILLTISMQILTIKIFEWIDNF